MYFDVTATSLDRSRKVVRAYCDICEEFDSHDTEDCPTQADDGDHYTVKTDRPVGWDDFDDDETF